MDILLVTALTVLGIVFVSYVVSSLGLMFYLKKMEDSNTWLAFVPFVNTYKQFKIVYDGFSINKVKTIEDKEKHFDMRKSVALALFFGYLGFSFVIGLLVGFTEPINIEATNQLGQTEYLQVTGSLALDLLSTLIALAVVGLVTYGMAKSMVVKDTGEDIPTVMVVTHVILTVVTFGIYTIILMYYYGLSSNRVHKISLINKRDLDKKKAIEDEKRLVSEVNSKEDIDGTELTELDNLK